MIDSEKTTIALDLFGGDWGIEATSKACLHYLENNAEVQFALVGSKELALKYTPKLANYEQSIKWIETSEKIEMDDSPARVIRNKTNSSMHLCANEVLNKQDDIIVSAGNTGALMAISRNILGMIPGIDRPAIMAAIPKVNKELVYILDLGANTDSDPDLLYQFSILGAATLDLLEPNKVNKTYLLNIGTERNKGNSLIKTAYNLISANKKIHFKAI